MWRHAILLGALGACTSTPARPDTGDCVAARSFEATSWPEADLLFHQSDRWAGADAAFTVDLGGDRILWLFGDTFVSKSAGSGRSSATMPRNTVALQTGRDPSKATISFYWHTTKGQPSSFFPDAADSWFWPQHGVRIGDRLILFLSQVKSVTTGLGFEAVGGVALEIAHPDAAPDAWIARTLDPPAHDHGAILGAAALVSGDSLFAIGLVEPGNHDAFLVRWPLDLVKNGSLAAPEWWFGGQWSTKDAQPLWNGGAPELSVQARCDGFVAVESIGFGGTTLGVRTAPHLTGPWTDPVAVFRPPESDRKDAFVYAGKAHPELTGADLVATYASNSMDFATLVNDPSLYYPRFVRLNVKP